MLVEGLNVRITEGLSKLEEVVFQLSEKETETNKDYTYTVDLVKPFHISLEGPGQYTTTCGPCHKTCHNNCLINNNSNKFYFWSMNAHGKNLPYLIDYYTVTETRTAEDQKKNYYKAVKEQNYESNRGIAHESLRHSIKCRRNFHISFPSFQCFLTVSLSHAKSSYIETLYGK